MRQDEERVRECLNFLLQEQGFLVLACMQKREIGLVRRVAFFNDVLVPQPVKVMAVASYTDYLKQLELIDLFGLKGPNSRPAPPTAYFYRVVTD